MLLSSESPQRHAVQLSDPSMPLSLHDSWDLCTFQYIVTHVFCPLHLPSAEDRSIRHETSLVRVVASALRLFNGLVDQASVPYWHSIPQMLDDLQAVVQFESMDRSQIVSQLTSTNIGGVLAFLIRAQNAAVLFRKQEDVTIFESFEVSPKAENVMTTQGKLICSYPGPAIEIPNTVFEDERFLSELANFLVRMNDDTLDAVPTSLKAQSTVIEARDTAHPRYITELLTGILRGLGRPANVARITKRVGDDVVWNNSRLPWRRSPLWLLIRVAIQTSLDRSSATYKRFMLFFMCCLANDKLIAELPNDLLQFMAAKISRRLRKLGSSAPDWLSCTVSRTCTSLRSMLGKRWTQVQVAQRASPVWTPSQLDLTRDIELSLLDSREYIHNSLTHHATNSPRNFFGPKHILRGFLDDFLSSNGAFFDEAYRTEPYVALYDVERAVRQEIDAWADRVTDNDEACTILEILGDKYSSSALKTYGDNPELLSIMLLTTIELWVTLDKIAIREIPMLADYSPEVPMSLIEELLLCKSASLSRLRRIHQYLSRRHTESRRHATSQNQWSIFSSAITENTFAARYYKESFRLQQLRGRIEETAQRDAVKKIAELEKANAYYLDLKQRVIDTEHASAVAQDGREFHPKKCQKCQLERKLRRMNIAVHEWPLPAKTLQAQVVLFELDCPVSFNMWRSATLHLLIDLCSSSPEPKDPYIRLDQYNALQPYLVQHPRSRITLGSDTKPFIVTHYRKAPIPATQKQVCVNNGLTFYGYDTLARVRLSEALDHTNVRRFCTYRLQSGPYQNLQKYVDATSHTSNEVMANQLDCHKDLSIHEFIAFGHLRSGDRLQWLNILRVLRDRSLSFRRQEVHALIAQAVSQVGPLVDADWVWHQEIREPSFCHTLISELEGLMEDVKANWLEGVTVDTISFLLRRLLVFGANQVASHKVFELLRTMRQRVFLWVTDLSDKLVGTRGDEELRELLRDTAAICRSTFDVDPAMFREVLCSAEDVKALVFSGILIHDNTPGKVSCLPIHSRLLLDRDRSLSLVIEPFLRNMIQTHVGNQGLDLAVGRVWPHYRPGSRWKPLQHTDSSWLSCQTAPTISQSSQAVSLNLLDGSLLVDGKPLGRLPTAVVQHPLYSLIFGREVLDVIPADLPGMDYSTRGVISDHQVHFSLKNDDLVIRAKRESTSDSAITELIPHEKLAGDLPKVLIEGHAHWLNLSTSMLEIRPLEKLWECSSENWNIDCAPGGHRMHKGRKYLVDIRSPTWTMVSSLLKPLDSPQNLIVTVSSVDPNKTQTILRLSVYLPRYGLSFDVDDDGDLRSRNIRGMVYDEDQSIGAMFGLVNQLVLRPKSKEVNSGGLVPRCVLIPEGDISFRRHGHHVRVEIGVHGLALQRATYQTYKIDGDLGCLTGNVSLTNKLYCAYLHALTSGCGTDPLTGRSGTEEALSLLRSASCSSIMRVGSREAELLGLIASICPMRTWYPEHLKCMQKVELLDLPVSTQHHELYAVAKGIKEHCERVLLFHGNQSSTLFQSFPSHNEHLLKRNALRAAYLFPSESSGQSSGETFDVIYPARDLAESGSGEQRAYAAATMVYYRSTRGISPKCIKDMLKEWERETVSAKAPLSLQYDRSWVDPNLPSIWLEAYSLLRKNDDGKYMQMLFSLPAMAYGSLKHSELVPAFVAFATNPRYSLEDPPPYDSYNLSHGYHPAPAILHEYVLSSAHPFESSPESTEPAISGESPIALRDRQFKKYFNRVDSDANATVCQMVKTGPCEAPPQCSLDPDSYNVANLTSNIQDRFSSCYRNLKLKEHFNRVQMLLSSVPTRPVPIPNFQYSIQPSQAVHTRVSWSLAIDQLFTRPPPSLQPCPNSPRYTAEVQSTPRTRTDPLHKLIEVVAADAMSKFQRRYATELRESADNFEGDASPADRKTTRTEKPTTQRLQAHYNRCRLRYVESLDCLKRNLGPISQGEQALEQSGQWPRVTAHTLLRFLASNSPVVLPDDWKGCLTDLAFLLLELQRARRLLRLYLDGLHEEFFRESENQCNRPAINVHPDWLLIQLQSNFLIRPVQVWVANEMISPHSGKNTVMQLNMGEGKSSVIVPISAAILADGDQIVRVVVPKALTAQMFQLLVDRLGGLTNRRIYFIPFSRSLEVNAQQVLALRQLMEECMHIRGILVVQPAHVLSLKLVSVEKQLAQAEDSQVSARLLDLQRWLHSHSRDILDESDEILHVRYQLVYTIGLQQPMEGIPERWTTTQQVLGLLTKCVPSLRTLFPLGIEYERSSSGTFPRLRILQADIGRELISCIVEAVMDGQLPNFNFQQLPLELQNTIQSFISCQDVPPSKVELVKNYCQRTSLWGGLLLLRGLLAAGTLLFALTERRWRVDYGLAPKRTMLAVPYRAKDVPAQRAEFGHPDVAIILTCLSYYYGGLNIEQLRASFEILLKQEDPSLDYDLWIRDCRDVPEDLRTWSSINIKSSEQWQNSLLPLFSRNKATVDFYLSKVVFPREAKEFPSKLSCSGWDLAEERERLLTGFSGTNDNKYLLPLHVAQDDPVHQRGTNAKVLAYLLQPENNHYMCTAQATGGQQKTSQFLCILTAQRPRIHVLLDVGAQMLDLQNRELAEEWLAISPESSAAIYFNEDDELTVLTRDGGTQLLLSSPFAQQLDQCVIYLDDAHTRGTDINFPSGFRAAVTLGPKVTKDRLAQGCMRMRKLGHGHSIMFFAPLEVDRRIRYVVGRGPLNPISVTDILQWAIRETLDDIQQRAPHWAQQGIDHTSRYAVWTSFCKGELSSQELSDNWLQPETKRLEDLYEPRSLSNSTFATRLDVHQSCNELGVPSLHTVDMDEQQEREVVHEAEREKHVERPPKVPPATHSIHIDVIAFVKTGIVPPNTTAFRPAFKTLDKTSAAFNEVHIWSPSVLATMDFEKTVVSSGKVDDYLRPVMWVVSGKGAHNEVLVIFSPYEVNHLLPDIRSSGNVRLHLYTPRITKSTKPCDGLALYSFPIARAGWIPSPPMQIMDQLNVFAGQLYLEDYEAYIRLCRFLCVFTVDLQCKKGIEVEIDGFITPKHRPRQLRVTNTFQSSPMDSLKTLTSLRRKGIRFAPTHMGKLLDGQVLTEDDFVDGYDNAQDD